MNHVDKYYWIIDHPKLTIGGGQASIELTPHMVNPDNETIETEDNKQHLNTTPRWWVEVLYEVWGKYEIEYCHDGELDCGGETAEDAINTLYELVLTKYGDY
ncbi:hypothetical protein S14_179 [Shewanella sp. phage 1/4]|uniref:hypothetical protein n=1 Tax=Shewanella phage 1/4 TaxID=1458859 RepID=UPI0004F91FE7|nr:hypothetical protein S14_179 [Shewanella sp. phage 1/4]AHK11288.1 hypothetical protein S14_179 [Shewanella sp. phage 1/4]